MADSNINVNKIDFMILAEYTQKEHQPDGSVLYLKFVQEGADGLELERNTYRGEYTFRITHKRVRLVKFFSIKRNSTNRYYLTACEVGMRTFCGQFESMLKVNEWLRDNFTERLDKNRGKR